MLHLQLLKAVNMTRISHRAPRVLAVEQWAMLKELSTSRMAPAREVERAKVLSGYADGISSLSCNDNSDLASRRSTVAWTKRWPQACRWA